MAKDPNAPLIPPIRELLATLSIRPEDTYIRWPWQSKEAAQRAHEKDERRRRRKDAAKAHRQWRDDGGAAKAERANVHETAMQNGGGLCW